jgi:hypothetical protein
MYTAKEKREVIKRVASETFHTKSARARERGGWEEVEARGGGGGGAVLK